LTPQDSSDKLRGWLALWRTPRVGCRAYHALLDRFGDPAEAFRARPEELAGLGLAKGLGEPDWLGVEHDLRWLEGAGRHCLTFDDPAYPAALKEIADPPPLLFVRGNPAILSNRQLAIVGSRNPSPLGLRYARDFACALAQDGWTIASGLALGVDAAAHRGALEGGGTTLAVAGTGLDMVYPARHRELAEAIVEAGGALVSEFPTATPPQAGNFPRRNRIISGLAKGVLVVEAALRSGSLITARMALEQGREVFAMPGAVNNPLARGCNALIKQGAKLVETEEDILEEFGGWISPPANRPAAADSDDRLDSELSALLKSVAYGPTSVDTLVEATGLTPEAIGAMLLLLELRGYVTSAGSGYCRIK
jgi:DNA processing protein